MKKKVKDDSLIHQLGDCSFNQLSFPDLDSKFSEFKSDSFKQLPLRKRFRKINETLLDLIRKAPEHSFLLPSVIDFIGKVNQLQTLDGHFHMSSFEFWLNQFSEVSDEENYKIRAKIAGKYIPRDEYQRFFPIGMDKTFNGTHFVAAHLSPDVDTMVASLSGWLDAFAARVGSASHIWALPGGPPDSPVTTIFHELFGKAIFNTLANVDGALVLRAIDLVTQQGVIKVTGKTSLNTLDVSSGEKAIILVDEEGHYLGDWHSSDIGPIRKIIIRFKSCLRWFENNLHVQLISLFAQKNLKNADISPFLSSVFDIAICDCEPAKEFTDRQKSELHDFFKYVLGLEKGIESSFKELNQGLANLSIYELSDFQKEVEALKDSNLFDSKGKLQEDRPAIFHVLEKIIHRLDGAIQHVRDYIEQLDVAIRIKDKVFGIEPQLISMRSDIESMRMKMKKMEYLTVVIPEDSGKLFPLGVVWAHQLQQKILGTVTFRDFCNEEEVRMASYLAPISVIDHHKSSLNTSIAPMALIGDTQSCNVLIAEQDFKINALYSLGGISPQELEKSFEKLHQDQLSPSHMRLLQRALERRTALHNTGKEYFIHPDRELTEYICFLHAILDDTDLLTKVSKRDVECVVDLLNRIKSLMMKQDVEIINLDDIPKDKKFSKKATRRILQHPEMYAFYKRIYLIKEMEIEKSLSATSEEDYQGIFLDTKVQNGCCRVGQTKLFTCNIPTYRENALKLMKFWWKQSRKVNAASPEIDLFLHMISTIPSADEVFEDKVGNYTHQDELWFWVPPSNQKAYDHLSHFLNSFQPITRLGKSIQVECYQGVSEDVKKIFSKSCAEILMKSCPDDPTFPIVVMRFHAGLLNSRKAMITPYLPNQ